MDDWLERKGSLVSVSDEEKKSPSNGDEQAEPSTSVGTGEDKTAQVNGGREEEDNGEASAGTGIIDTVASKFGVSVPGFSSKQEGAHKEESSGGIINQLISKLPESIPLSEDEVPAADEASLLISIIED